MKFNNKSKKEIAKTVIKLVDYFTDPMILEISKAMRKAEENKDVVTRFYLHDIVNSCYIVDEIFNLNRVNFIFITSRIHILNDLPIWVYRSIAFRNNTNGNIAYKDVLGGKFTAPGLANSETFVSSSVDFTSRFTDSHTTFFPLFNSLAPTTQTISSLISQL